MTPISPTWTLSWVPSTAGQSTSMVPVLGNAVFTVEGASTVELVLVACVEVDLVVGVVDAAAAVVDESVFDLELEGEEVALGV